MARKRSRGADAAPQRKVKGKSTAPAKVATRQASKQSAKASSKATSSRRQAKQAPSRDSESDSESVPDESDYGSSDLDESSDDGAGNVMGDESSADEAEIAHKGRSLEEGGILKTVKPTPAALRLHVDDLSSDEEEAKNTIGDVPLEWYNDYDHIGYDLAGKPFAKLPQQSAIDRFLQSQDDPHFRWRITDPKNGEEILLSKREVQLLRRIQTNKFPHPEFDAYPDYDPWFSSQKEIHPIDNAPEPKRRFQPSKWEKMKVMKIVKRIKEGRYQVGRPKPKPTTFLLWGEDDSALDHAERKKAPTHIPAPKIKPPGHAASYNPPEEYLLTKEEQEKWEAMDPEDRPLPFMPTKFKSLRHVPLYKNFIRERFDRCLDLYLCPRTIKRRLNVDPETLLPKLPSPEELRPYPTTKAIEYVGHTGRVRSLSVSPSGEYLVTASQDKTVRLWEVDTGREMQCWTMEEVPKQVAYNPNPQCHCVAVASAKSVILLSTGTACGEDLETTFKILSGANADASAPAVQAGEGSDDELDEDARAASKAAAKDPVWTVDGLTTASELAGNMSARVTLTLPLPVKFIAWHHKGDYISTVAPQAVSAAVAIHQVSRRRTQRPFRRNIGLVQSVAFHPSRPLFYCVNQRNIRIYNLLRQSLDKKLSSGCKWVSSLSIHPTGDHLIVGSYDKKVVWFDTELSSQAFKTLRYNKEAVRHVEFHKSYPLMCTAGDDGNVHILHSKVFGDFVQNPLIVPVKVLRAHKVTADKLGVLSSAWHPTQPWLFTAGADHGVKLFQNIP